MTKLVRNVMMAIIIPVMAYLYKQRNIESAASSPGAKINPLKLFPLFIVGFLMMAILRSIGDAGTNSGGQAFAILTTKTWKVIVINIKQWSGYILATTMAGVGLGTSIVTMRGLGIKLFYVGLFAAAVVGVTSLVLVLLIGQHVTL